MKKLLLLLVLCNFCSIEIRAQDFPIITTLFSPPIVNQVNDTSTIYELDNILPSTIKPKENVGQYNDIKYIEKDKSIYIVQYFGEFWEQVQNYWVRISSINPTYRKLSTDVYVNCNNMCKIRRIDVANGISSAIIQLSIKSERNIEFDADMYNVHTYVSPYKKIQVGTDIYNQPIYNWVFNIEGIVITKYGEEIFAKRTDRLKQYIKRERIRLAKEEAVRQRQEDERLLQEQVRKEQEERERLAREQKIREYKAEYQNKLYSVQKEEPAKYEKFVKEVEEKIFERVLNGENVNSSVNIQFNVDTLGHTDYKMSNNVFHNMVDMKSYPILTKDLSEIDDDIDERIYLPSYDTVTVSYSKKTQHAVISYRRNGVKIISGDTEIQVPEYEFKYGYGKYDAQVETTTTNDLQKIKYSTTKCYFTDNPTNIKANRVRHLFIGYDYSRYTPIGVSLGAQCIAKSRFGLYGHYKTAFAKFSVSGIPQFHESPTDFKYKGVVARSILVGPTVSATRWLTFNIGAGYGTFGHKYGNSTLFVQKGFAFEAGAMFRIYRSLALTAGYNGIVANGRTRIMNDFNVGISVFIW